MMVGWEGARKDEFIPGGGKVVPFIPQAFFIFRNGS